MASLRLRGDRWQARVTRVGHAPVVRSFVTKQDAERWARSIEIEIDRGSFVNPGAAQKITVADLIGRYMREVTPLTKSAKEDSFRLAALRRHRMCKVSVSSLTASAVAAYRDERLKVVSPGSVIRELANLSSIINHARSEWRIQAANPVSQVRKPPTPRGRARLLSPAERERLLETLKPIGRRSVWMTPLVMLALETAMRRGELLALTWANVDLCNRLAVLDDSKNGDRRVVPLSSQAVAVLNDLPKSTTGKVFPMNGPAVSKAWDDAMKRVGIEDLHFHDLRHTAITAMAEKLPNLIELAAVSGHKSVKMLQRYYHPNVQDLARKLG